MQVFRVFRDLSVVIGRLGDLIAKLVDLHQELGSSLDRLTALELRMATFEAEVQGMLLKAENKLSAAHNAEQRERQLKRSYERQLDILDPDGNTEPRAVPSDDAQASEEEKVPALHLGVDQNSRAVAVRAKWAR